MEKTSTTISNSYTTEELASLRKLAPRALSGAFLCEEYNDQYTETGLTFSVRLDYRLIHEQIEFPDCATWRVAAFNLETPAYCHHGFCGTFAELLEKTCADLQRVAGSYAPKLRETIMKSVYDAEKFINGGSDDESTTSPSGPPAFRPVIFRLRDPSGLTRSTIFRPHCMKILHDLRAKEIEKLWQEEFAHQQDEEEEITSFEDKYNKITLTRQVLPIYNVTRYNRTWEEDRELGIFTYDLVSPLTPQNQPFTTPQEIAQLVKNANNIVLLSGAGISVESGIKPFRTSNTKDGEAIWKNFDATKMTVDNFNNDKDVVRSWWDMKRGLYRDFTKAKANPAHKFFGKLHQMGKLRGVITQNIDSLHIEAGVPKEKLVELHGHMRTLVCSDKKSDHNNAPIMKGTCDFEIEEPFLKNPEYLSDVGKLNREVMKVAGNTDNEDDDENETPSSSWMNLHQHVPLCSKCKAPLRTPTIMFGQNLPSGEWDRARRMIGHSKNKNTSRPNDSTSCDLLFVVGTSLVVAPANDLPGQCLRNGIPVVMINMDSTMYDQFATGLVYQPAGQFLAEVEKYL